MSVHAKLSVAGMCLIMSKRDQIKRTIQTIGQFLKKESESWLKRASY